MVFDVVDNFPIAFFMIENNHIVDCNINLAHLFGYSKKEDMIGLKPWEIITMFSR